MLALVVLVAAALTGPGAIVNTPVKLSNDCAMRTIARFNLSPELVQRSTTVAKKKKGRNGVERRRARGLLSILSVRCCRHAALFLPLRSTLQF